MPDMLFPEYLNKGSRGPAVAALQLMLKAAGFDRLNGVVVDGDYGEVTAETVQRLQRTLKVTQDGNFGPETRKALRGMTGLNVDSILADVFVGETQAVGPT